MTKKKTPLDLTLPKDIILMPDVFSLTLLSFLIKSNTFTAYSMYTNIFCPSHINRFVINSAPGFKIMFIYAAYY